MNATLRNLLLLIAIVVLALGIRDAFTDHGVPQPPTTTGGAGPEAAPADAKDRDADQRTQLTSPRAKPTPNGNPTGVVQVKVQTSGGAPIADCLVSLGDGVQAHSDAQGLARFELPPQRVWLDVTPPTETDLCSFKSRLTIDRGLTKDVLVVLTSKTPELWCRLVDSVSKAPIADATVVVHPREHQPFASDAKGVVKLAMRPADEYALASANGYAPRRIVLVPGHAADDSILEVPLEPSAALEVTCVDNREQPLADALVTVRALARDMQWPRDQSLVGTPQSWSARTDKDGRLTITDLPSGTNLYLETAAPTASAPAPMQNLQLKPGANAHRIAMPGVGTIRGRVLDAAGAPVAGVNVACVQTTSQDTPALFPGHGLQSEAFTTGSDGRFELTPLQGGSWLVGLNQSEGWAAPCLRVELAAAGTAEIELRAQRELAISGRLTGPDGAPIGAFEVRAEREGMIVAAAITEKNGTFRLAPLLAGDYDVTTELYDNRLALPKPMRAAAGTSGVAVHVAPVTGIVRGTVEADDMRGGEVWFRGYRRGGTESTELLCDVDGGFAIESLRSGVWDFHAEDNHGRIATRPGVVIEAGKEVAALDLALTRGGHVHPMHPDADTCVVHRGDATLCRARLDGGLPPEVTVPPGTCTVTFLRSGLEVARATVSVRAGEHLQVDGSKSPK